jgi:hypothetical protein
LLLWTKPWLGGDGSLSFFFSLLYASFPSALAGAAVFAGVTELANGTWFEHYMCCTPVWWSAYFGIQLVLGYAQWLVIAPMLWRGFRERPPNG